MPPDGRQRWRRRGQRGRFPLMLSKLLAWSALGLALLFVILMLTAIFAGSSLGAAAPLLVYWGAIPLLGIAILLAVVLLVISSFSSDS